MYIMGSWAGWVDMRMGGESGEEREMTNGMK
jgi:hypothetical protein